MKTETLLDILASLQGDALEQAYVVLRNKVIRQREAQRQPKPSHFLILVANRRRGSRFTSVHGLITPNWVKVACYFGRPGDKVLKRCLLTSRPEPDALRGIVADIFTRLNPDWKGVPQWIDHEDGGEFTMKAV